MSATGDSKRNDPIRSQSWVIVQSENKKKFNNFGIDFDTYCSNYDLKPYAIE